MPIEGYQGESIEIVGKNFWSSGKSGKVFLGNEELVADLWDNEKIIIKQPVLGKFGKTELYLVRTDGLKSNKIYYTVKDPGKLK